MEIEDQRRNVRTENKRELREKTPLVPLVLVALLGYEVICFLTLAVIYD